MGPERFLKQFHRKIQLPARRELPQYYITAQSRGRLKKFVFYKRRVRRIERKKLLLIRGLVL